MRWYDIGFVILLGSFLGYTFVYYLPQQKSPPNIEKLLEAEAEITNKIELLLTVHSIIICESSGRHENIWGDKNYKFPAYGIAQIQERTFYWLANKANFKHMKWKDKKDQIKLLMWAIENGYGSLWTCFKK